MVRLPKEKWPDTDGSRGILMFAQLMSEMLTPTTFESFRVYSLDTTARVGEALNLVTDVEKQRVPRPVLDPVVQEMKWSFAKDAASQSLAANEIDSLNTLLRSKFSLDDFAAHLRLINKLIEGKYKKTLELHILDLFDRPKQRMDFRKLVGFYCSHLVNLGYERNHIRRVVEETFFEKPVVRMGRKTLEKFLSKFTGNERQYTVQVGITRELGRYLHGPKFDAYQRVAGSSYESTLDKNTNKDVLTHVFNWNVRTLDPESAMESANHFLNAQRAISFLDPYGMHCEWGNTMHVTLSRAKSGQAITSTDVLENKPRPFTTKKKRRVARAGTIRDYAADIVQNFDEASTERLLSSIRTAALARTSSTPENRLISLWSAIEVLLSEPSEEARIVHYAKHIVPCIVMRHTRRQVIAIYNDLLPRYRSRLNKMTRQLETDLHGQDAFAELILLEENKEYQKKLCGLLADNPLALHRVFKLQRDHMNTTATIGTIDDHYDRVRWQIHRIYRARNQLVHAGLTPSYLDSIILNLAEYYRSAIVTIVGRAKKEEELSDINQVVSEIGIQYRIMRNFFSNTNADKRLTKGHVAELMHKK